MTYQMRNTEPAYLRESGLDWILAPKRRLIGSAFDHNKRRHALCFIPIRQNNQPAMTKWDSACVYRLTGGEH